MRGISAACYGKRLASSTPAVKDGIGYTGHVEDAATGMTYMQQRYYDPGIGRFLSRDPVSANPNTGANFNAYWYANNNPYKFIDPDGRFGCTGSRIKSVCDRGGVVTLRTSARSPLDTGGNEQSGSPRRPAPENAVTRNEYKGSPSTGEKKQAVDLVGPLDALKAKSAADKALEAARDSGLPGLHNGPGDAFRHCLWSCEMSRDIGAGNAKLLGDNHEAWGVNPVGETRMDLFNNREGRENGSLPGTCAGLCMHDVRDGSLMLTPEEGRP